MPHFRKGNDVERSLVRAMLDEHHGALTDADVTIDVLVAFATKNEDGSPRGPALSHGGYPAIATVKINSLKLRVLGSADALITLDGDRWGDFSDDQQRAIIDHELTHLELVTDDESGAPEGDDIGRPRLRIRKHDHQFGWFDAVVRRHGRHSIEWSQFDAFRQVALKQTWLPGFEGDSEFASAVEGAMQELERRGVEVRRNVKIATAAPGVSKRRKAASHG